MFSLSLDMSSLAEKKDLNKRLDQLPLKANKLNSEYKCMCSIESQWNGSNQY